MRHDERIIKRNVKVKENKSPYDNEKCQFYIQTLVEKFNKFISLEEILKIEKDFVLKTFSKKEC